MNRRKTLAFALAGPVALSLLVAGGQAGGAPTEVASGATVEYTVLIETGATRQAAVDAVAAAGGTVVRDAAAVGALVVNAPANGFIQLVSASDAVYGAAHATPIGRIPRTEGGTLPRDEVSSEHSSTSAAAPAAAPAVGMDPLDNLLYGLHMVRSDLARAVQAGDSRVLVGVLDSGVDATHPDIAPNYNAALSRNFATDIPADPNGVPIDGPCEFAGCVDPPGWDDSGHGTHVAGTIAAAANGFGVSGVAPNVSIVSIRGGQDSGYVFLQPVLDALVYGADVGLDVINMSFYIDPWLYNCTSNPADSPEDQLEQRATIEAVNRALTYAHTKGVTLINSLGNEHNDHGNPRDDLTSPDYPVGAEYPRDIDNATCLSLPVEGKHVIGVSSLGPTFTKADYSNYGTEQITVSAPGGWFRDGLGTPSYRTNENMVLSTYPRNVLLARGWIDAEGNVTPAGVASAVLRYCDATQCGYYRYIQGTSMAAPHATGVAALIVSRFGREDASGLTLPPGRVEDVLTSTAANRACPNPPLQTYVPVGRSPEFDALCVGTAEFNGFYGYGVVDAYAAVTAR